MVGYENILSANDLALHTGVLLSIVPALGVVLIKLLLQQYWDGMAGWDAWDEDRNDIPVYKWVKTATGWKQIRTLGAYSTYHSDFRFTYKWSANDRDMAFIQSEPPPECTVFMSAGMAEHVDKIIEKTVKEAYY